MGAINDDKIVQKAVEQLERLGRLAAEEASDTPLTYNPEVEFAPVLDAKKAGQDLRATRRYLNSDLSSRAGITPVGYEKFGEAVLEAGKTLNQYVQKLRTEFEKNLALLDDKSAKPKNYYRTLLSQAGAMYRSKGLSADVKQFTDEEWDAFFKNVYSKTKLRGQSDSVVTHSDKYVSKVQKLAESNTAAIKNARDFLNNGELQAQAAAAEQAKQAAEAAAKAAAEKAEAERLAAEEQRKQEEAARQKAEAERQAAEAAAKQHQEEEAAAKAAAEKAKAQKAAADAYAKLNKDEKEWQKLSFKKENGESMTNTQADRYGELKVAHENSLDVITAYEAQYGQLTELAKERAEIEAKVSSDLSREREISEEIKKAEKERKDADKERLKAANETNAAEKKARAEAEKWEKKKKTLGDFVGQGFTKESVGAGISEYLNKIDAKAVGDLISKGIDSSGLEKFTQQITTADGKAQKLTVTLNTVNGELYATARASESSGTTLQKFIGGLQQKFMALGQWLASFGLARRVFQFAQQGYQNVRELNAAFVELSRISNDSTKDLQAFREQSFNLASEIGSTATTVLNAATTWEHLGYSIKESTDLAKSSAVYTNIADGMQSDAEATEDLVSILKAYNKEASESMDVVDALIATSNNYAVSAADIGNILKRSSSALAVAGNSMEETIALGTAMSEVLQSPEVAGTTLKTLSLRLRSSKTELEEMGEGVEDLVTSTPKLQKQIKALTKGFDILDDAGNIKSTYEIMKGISNVWGDMKDTDRAKCCLYVQRCA